MNKYNPISGADVKLENALQLHRMGDFKSALKAYECYLAIDPNEILALYGAASIRLSWGDISAYSIAQAALFSEHDSTLDKAMAAHSIIRTLLSQQYHDHAKALLDDCQAQGVVVHDQVHLRRAVETPNYLEATRYDPLQQRELERYHPMESEHYVYAIDIVGGCNLRCPTCPVSSNSLPKGLMDLQLYQDILTKIRTESIDAQPDIWLFNWTEPLLHPHVDQFIEATHAMGMSSFISTNLNMGARIPSVMRANPTRLKISLSSLDQAIYSQTHRRGDIAKVIENLHALAHWRDYYQSTTEIWIGHHLYRHTYEEQEQVKALAQTLGFGYSPSVAIVAPLERVMQMENASEEDKVAGMRQQLLYDPVQLQQVNARKRSGKKDCELRFNMMTIAYNGVVNLCCATTQSLAKEPIAFLDYSHAELEDMKYHNTFCKHCMKANLHLTIADR